MAPQRRHGQTAPAKRTYKLGLPASENRAFGARRRERQALRLALCGSGAQTVQSVEGVRVGGQEEGQYNRVSCERVRMASGIVPSSMFWYATLPQPRQPPPPAAIHKRRVAYKSSRSSNSPRVDGNVPLRRFVWRWLQSSKAPTKKSYCAESLAAGRALWPTGCAVTHSTESLRSAASLAGIEPRS